MVSSSSGCFMLVLFYNFTIKIIYYNLIQLRLLVFKTF